jgi:hypothetical protein
MAAYPQGLSLRIIVQADAALRRGFTPVSDAMKNLIWPLFPVVLALAAVPLLAQESTPVSPTAKGTWSQYSGMYPHSPLCDKDEITLWSCENSKRVYALCASHVVTRTSGYLQYRASKRGKVVFTYPTEKKPPLGLFVYNLAGNGNASVEFMSNGYGYALFDPLREESSIQVSAPAPSGKQTEIACGGNQTLQVNYTMQLMRDAGVWTED